MPILSMDVDRRGVILAYSINPEAKDEASIVIEIDQQTADIVRGNTGKKLLEILHDIKNRQENKK